MNTNFIRCNGSLNDNGSLGGAIYILMRNQCQAIISNCKFQQCQAYSGGGIFTDMFNGGNLTIDGQCQFIDCYSYNTGGGLYISNYNAGSIFILQDAYLKGCKSASSAGGIYIFNMNEAVFHINNVTVDNCRANSGGGLLLVVFYNQYQQLFISGLTVSNCTASDRGGGMRIYNEAVVNDTIEFRDTSFVNCSALDGGGIDLQIWGILSIFSSNLTFRNCSARNWGGGILNGNGGGIYINLNISTQYEVVIKDLLVQNCKATTNISQSKPPTGYGGGIFLTSNKDYNPSTNVIDFRGLKIYNNSADKAGQSLYVVMIKLAELCQQGESGEYIKGNYTDGISQYNELEGIPVDSKTFNSCSSSQIKYQQNYLESYWDLDPNEIYYVQYIQSQSTGIDQEYCGRIYQPCKTIEYALQQISFRKAGSITSFVDQKNIGF
ncbi:MAG: hypothetical protein EZS28_022684 [Streblomastix strix]|uniref:Right handed beta helix domain-containing protein n=1 Tax=Streblomastix strix TaxID=222440 RepID=A0A5J4VGQ0_9EUKA|nr:MAG: hypothetical protein EZS28_022684 [Streblomastix strix]